MALGIARLYQDVAGGPLISGSNNSVFINGMPGAVMGARVASHGDSPHNNASMITNSSSVFFDGMPACRMTDISSCGHAAIGSSNVFAG